MTNPQTPEDGDFAAYLEKRAAASQPAQPPSSSEAELQEHSDEAWGIETVPPGTPPIPDTDEELERQALAHPGADGDPNTPE